MRVRLLLTFWMESEVCLGVGGKAGGAKARGKVPVSGQIGGQEYSTLRIEQQGGQSFESTFPKKIGSPLFKVNHVV